MSSRSSHISLSSPPSPLFSPTSTPSSLFFIHPPTHPQSEFRIPSLPKLKASTHFTGAAAATAADDTTSHKYQSSFANTNTWKRARTGRFWVKGFQGMGDRGKKDEQGGVLILRWRTGTGFYPLTNRCQSGQADDTPFRYSFESGTCDST